MSLSRKELIAQKLLLRGKIKKVLFVHTCVHWSKELGMHMTKTNRLYVSCVKAFLGI